MPFTQSSSTGIVGFETNEAGHLVFGRINSVPPAGLDTTTALYAAGCKIIESSTSNEWVNVGTSTTPVWALNSPITQQYLDLTVPAASIPLLFGGTNVQVLAAPAGGTAQAYVINNFVLEYVGVGGTAFTAGGSTVRIVYGSAGTNVAAYMNLGTSTFFGTATKVFTGLANSVTTGVQAIPGMGLYLDNTTAAYATAGTSNLRIKLWYATIAV